MTPELARTLYTYEPETGALRHAVKYILRNVGEEVGRIFPDGYRYLMHNYKRYLAHRVAWMHFHGVEIPAGYMIDHADGNRSNNSINNLRLATRAQNQWNRHAKVRAKSGIRGVYAAKDCARWGARIRHNGKQIHLGLFATPEEATKARREAEIMYHGKFSEAIRTKEQPTG